MTNFFCTLFLFTFNRKYLFQELAFSDKAGVQHIPVYYSVWPTEFKALDAKYWFLF